MAQSIPPVLIRYAVEGTADVDRACATVEQRLLRMEKATTTGNDAATRSRVRNAETEAKAREQAAAKVSKEVERQEALQTREAERQERARERIRIRSSEMAGREAKKAADIEIRERERVARETERQEERMLRIRTRSAEMAGRAARREAQEELAARERLHRGMGASMLGSVGGVVGGIGSIAAGVVGIGGGFAVANAAGAAMRSQETASLIRNVVTVGNNGVAPPQASVDNLMSSAAAASKTTNVDRQTILEGALEYARKARGGDIAGVVGNMEFFAKMSKVTRASITDIAGAAGTLQSQNQDLSPAAMQQMLLDVFAQSGKGSLGMVDIAKQIGVMASARGAFAGDVATNQRKLLALGQLAAPEGSPEEAGTFIKDLVMEAGKHRKSTRDTVGLEQMGVRYDKYGRMESPEQMIDAVFKGTGGDITQIEKLFGARGKALFGALLNPYTSAGGGEKGIAAVNATLASVTQATTTTDQLNKMATEQLEQPGEKFNHVLNELTLSIESKLLPWMPRLASEAERLLPEFEAIVDEGAELAEWFAKNPFSGLGAIVALAVTKDLAEAGIGRAVSGAMTTAIGQSFAGGLAIASAAITVTQVGEMIIDMLAHEGVQQQRGAIAGSNEAANVALAVTGKARTGAVTPADISKAQAALKSIEAQEQAVEGRKPHWWSSGLTWAKYALGGGEAAQKAEMDNLTQSAKMLRQAIDMATVAARTYATEAAGNTNPNNPANSVPIDQRPNH